MSDQWGRRLFKTGAVLLIVMGLVHSLSLFQTPAPANDSERQLLDLMTKYKFNLMGSFRSMWDLLRGFSVAFLVAALAFGALDLSLSGERAELIKRLALINVIWLAVMTAVSRHYFFAVPTAFLAAGLIVFALAWMKLPAKETS